MNLLQNLIVVGYGLISLLAIAVGYREAIYRKNVFGLTPLLVWQGIFVWGDAPIIGLYGTIAATIIWIRQDWWLGALIWSVFWTVRSGGEIVYWLNQQFSGLERNPPKNLFGFRWFPNDSLWFVYQLMWQGVMVISATAAIIFARKWMGV